MRRSGVPVALGLWLIAAFATAVPGQGYAQSTATQDSLNCVVEPHRVVQVASPVVGVLAAVKVKRGDLVTKGQEVAKLESDVEKAQVALARAHAENNVELKASRARLDFETRQLARSESLIRKRVISSSKLDESRRDTEIARLSVKQSELNRRVARLELNRALRVLEQRTIHSPIDGVVVDRFLSPGEYVYEQAPIAKIAEIDRLNVEVFVPIERYGTVRLGTAADVQLQSPIGGSYKARVVTVDRVLDAASGTFRVRLELPNPDLRLPAGVRCTVRFSVGE